MVPSASYAILLVWLEEVKSRIEGTSKIPIEILLFYGLGKKKMERGYSPINIIISEMMLKIEIPFNVDRCN